MNEFAEFISDWWKIAAAALVGATGIVALRIRIDVNDLLKRRDDRLRRKAQRSCPHVMIRSDVEKGGVNVESTFQCPPGTLSWVCSMCQTIVNDDGSFARDSHQRWLRSIERDWQRGIKDWKEQYSRFQKLVRRL